jgi:hypothetical protein
MQSEQSASNKSLSAAAAAVSAAASLTSITAHRRKRLVRSDNVMTTSNNSNSSIGGSGSGAGGAGHYNTLRSVGMHYGWESLFRESLLHMAWPISLSMSQEDGRSGNSSASSPRNIMIDFLPLKVRYCFIYKSFLSLLLFKFFLFLFYRFLFDRLSGNYLVR